VRAAILAGAGLFFGALGPCNRPASAFETQCREIIPVMVTLMRSCSVGQEDAATTQLVAEAATEAVRKVIGVEATSRSVMSARDENGVSDERFRSRIVAQSSGYATVATTSHLIADVDGSHQVQMSFAAQVCIPREPRLVRQVIALGTFKSPDGTENARLKAEVGQIFSTSDGYALSPEYAADGFADIVLSGRVDSINVMDATSESSGAGLSGLASLDNRVGAGRRLVISGAVLARRIDSEQVTTQAVNDIKVIPAWANAELAAADFVAQRFSEAARDLHDRLLHAQGGSQPLPSKVFRGQAGGPQW
jgi:hypothetical protein